MTAMRAAVMCVACAGVSLPLSATTRIANTAATTVRSNVPAALRFAIDDALVGDRNVTGVPAWLEQELTATDGIAGDGFGYSVAMSGSTAVVGAMLATVGSTDAQGAAYVFTETGGVWTEQQRLVASDGQMYDGFGKTVAVNDDSVIVGAQNVRVAGHNFQGAAYVFSLADGVWTQTQKLVASDGIGGADFGGAMTMKGNVAIIGAYNAGANSSQRGEAYVFEETAGTWAETQRLTASDGADGDQFGHSFAFDGSTLLVGAWGVSIGANDRQGGAYVFTNDGSGWSETQKLLSSDGAYGDEFSASLAVDGDIALIGTPYATINGNQYQGAEYAFANSGGTWSETQKIVASDGQAFDGYGWFAAIDGSTALIGAIYASIDGNANQGAAYVLSNADATWTETHKFVASDGAAGSFFGSAGAISGTTAFIGAEDATVDGNALQGAAYVYTQPVSDTIFADGFDATP